MNIAPFVFIGLLATFSLSWFGYVYRPHAELSRQEPFKDAITGAVYPIARSGQAMQGAEVYRAQGCAACHTQQVRPASEDGTNDLGRGWGIRRTVAADYMLENPPQLGSIRLGPDLANVGLRKTTNDIAWHYQHLLDPKSVVPKSIMPAYKYLFDKRPVGAGMGAGIQLAGDSKFEYVPSDDGKALVAYLISLKNQGATFEAPVPPPATNAPAGDTNAPAGGTNAAPAGTNTPAPAANTNAQSK